MNGEASPASGVPKDAFLDRELIPDDINQNTWSVPWLLERKRSKHSTKWSGTNVHPSYENNKLGNILTAFAHFVYEYTYGSIVIADIQSMFLFLFRILKKLTLHL
jgi:hypothetical protein